MQDPRIEGVLGLWRVAARDLGLDAESYRHKLLWQKNEPDRSHIVLLLVGDAQKLVLKKVFAPENHSMKQAMDMQEAVSRNMGDDSAFSAPQVLFVSKDGSLSVMEYIPGKTVNDQLQAGKPANQILRRSGEWAASFHGSFSTNERVFQPHFMVNHISRVCEKVEASEVSLPERDLFIRCCERIPFIADQFMNGKTVSGQKHGDLNTRNILIGPKGVYGLDFAPESQAPVGYDIARFLMDYAELFQNTSDVTRGQLLSADAVQAFFKGYDLVGPDDPAVGFLPFVQILNDWRIIPAKKSDRSIRQSRRLAAIRELAEKGFMI